MKTIRISTLVHNRDWILPFYLQNIYNLKYEKKLITIRWIVNNSTDQSLGLLKNFKEKYDSEYKNIIIDVINNKDVPLDKRDKETRITKGIYTHLGKLRNMSGACLMGETPGYFIDAEAAEAILQKLSLILKFNINTDELEERAEETRKLLNQAQQMEQDMVNKSMGQSDDDLRYIG